MAISRRNNGYGYNKSKKCKCERCLQTKRKRVIDKQHKREINKAKIQQNGR